MHPKIIKFLLIKGLTLPRNIEELEYVKKHVFNEDEKIDTPTFQDQWEYMSKRRKKENSQPNELKLSYNPDGMARAARFGGEINDEVKRQMDQDKKETRKRMNNDNYEEESNS